EWAQAALAAGLDLVASRATRDHIDRELQSVFDRVGSEELAVSQLELLAMCLPRGLAFHHAGLVPTLRELVERLFEAGLIGVVFATGTLALGVNMPARTVVLEQLSTRDDNGWRPLAKREFLQMAGRAGRRGKDTFGHIVVLKHPFDQFESLERLLSLPPEPVSSAFQLDYASALYLLGQYGPEGMAEMYRRSFAVYRKRLAVEQIASAHPHAADRAPAFVARRRAQIDSDTAREARRLESVLGRFGYWDGRRVTERAAFLRRFFHGNALLTSELVIAKLLSGLDPAELAEAASWLEGGGRAGRGRRPPTLPAALQQRYRAILAEHRAIERVEEDHGLAVSAGLGPTANHGLVLRATRGESLTELCAHYALDPGDVYGRLTETEMWLRQLEGALTASGFDPELALASKRARVLLRLRAGSVGFTPVIGAIDDDTPPIAGGGDRDRNLDGAQPK
ncbi:MAG: hypothetical protein NZ518_03785, partial [Dehalococcoidia bacterium]|nr:hypothetical protein [Dehalococcoidia bacterium]